MRLPAPFLAIALLAGCGSQDNSNPLPEPARIQEAERYGGVGVVGVGDVNGSLNPLTAQYIARHVTRDLLFMPLVRYDRYGNPGPALAERWEAVRTTDDSLALTFYLRSDVRWHDGERTTADDVLFTFHRVFDRRYDHFSAHKFVPYRREAERINRHTVRFHLRAHPDFLKPFGEVPIAPRHLLGHVGPDSIAMHPFGHQPVGNGPFRFLRHVQSHELVLEANPDFPEALGGRPYLDRLVFREGTNPYAVRANLLTGRFHVGYMMKDQIEFPEPLPGFRFVKSPGSSSVWIAWDTRLTFAHDAGSRRVVGSRLRGVEPDAFSIFGSAVRWWLVPRQLPPL